MRKLVAQNDRVIIEPIKDKAQSGAGTFIIADHAQEKTKVGLVVSVGPGRLSEYGTFIKPDVKPGDVVMIPQIGTIRQMHEGEEYFICSGKEILATLEEEVQNDFLISK